MTRFSWLKLDNKCQVDMYRKQCIDIWLKPLVWRVSLCKWWPNFNWRHQAKSS